MKWFTKPALCLFLAGSAGLARQEWQICGTSPERRQEELALHRISRGRRAGFTESLLQPQRVSVARDIGHIAVLEDSDGVVARRNEFNLDNKSLRFVAVTQEATRYRAQVAEGGWDAEAASTGSPLVGLDDDDTRDVVLPFSFPFYGQRYTRVNVNSDGNLTFGGGDVAISERSLGRMTSGLPRISGLFRDLDPSLVPGGVRVLSQGGRFVVSWLGIPEYQPFGFGPVQTFQIRLFPEGRIEFAYQGISTRSAVVGIAPGNLLGASSVVSFVAGGNQEFSGAVAERFSGVEEVDTVFVAQKFYETHDDSYDYLAIYNNLGIAASPGAVAFEVTVRSDRQGIGDAPVDNGREYGSRRRLQAILNLGPLSQYPRDPNGVVPSRSLSRDTPLTILGHEVGHLFLAFASVRDPSNPSARPMLGRQSAHWNFTFNSEASLLEGNRIRDNGPGAAPRFTTIATVEGYSPLDQYLMGFRPPEEVPPTFLVTEATTGPSNRQPQAGVSFDGNRREIEVREVVEAEGRRTPDHTVSQRRFRVAFVLITAAGLDPTADQLAQIDAYRQNFGSFYERAADGRAFVETTLRQGIDLSVAPAAGVLEGATINATVSVSRPVAAPLTVLLRRKNGVTDAPASVVLAAGQAQASFPLRGLRAGVEELSAEPADDRFAEAHARVQVRPGPESLRLLPVSGDKQMATTGSPLLQPLVFKVTDNNILPYPGVAVSAAVTPGGTVLPARAFSDADGLVRFQWTPGPGQLHELTASVEGAPASRVTLTALGRPTLTAGGVVNAASFVPGLSPGSLATLFGLNLAAGTTAFAAPPFRDQLGGVRVLVNGLPALLVYVSDRQINFLVPSNLAPGEAEVVVSIGSGASVERTPPVRVAVKPVDPGIFFNTATGVGAVAVAGTGLTTAERPAAPGEVVEIYCTGLGDVRPSTAFPGLIETVAQPAVRVAGTNAEVVFSGLTPGLFGLYQINARVPAGLAAGLHKLVIEAGNTTSNEVSILVR